MQFYDASQRSIMASTPPHSFSTSETKSKIWFCFCHYPSPLGRTTDKIVRLASVGATLGDLSQALEVLIMQDNALARHLSHGLDKPGLRLDGIYQRWKPTTGQARVLSTGGLYLPSFLTACGVTVYNVSHKPFSRPARKGLFL